MRRLESPDMTYWFVNRAFGWSVVLQVVWTFPEPIDEHSLHQMNSDLAAGKLNRRVVTSPIPIARPRWSHAPDHPPVIIDTVAVADDAISAWATDELDTAALDAVHGRAWQLRGAPTTSGGYVVSLTTLHLLADGKGFVESAATAASGGSTDVMPIATGHTPRTLIADVGDAVSVVAEAGAGVMKAAVAAVRATRDTDESGRVEPARAGRRPMRERSPRARTSWVIVSVSAADWESAARRHNGTPNTLFVALIAGSLRRSGHLPATEPIKVGIPVSQRTEGDDRANATAGVSVLVTDEVTGGGDLTALRALCKRAYTRLAQGRRPPMMHLQPLINVLPTSVVATVATSGNGMPDVMTSNLGAFPAGYAEIGGVRATAVAFRGDAQGVDPDQPYRFGDGVQSWSLQVGDTVTMSIAAFDESAFADGSDLRDAVVAELGAWGVVHRIW